MSLLEHLMEPAFDSNLAGCHASGPPRILHVKSLGGASKHHTVYYLMICHRPKNRTENTNSESLSPKESKKKEKKASMCPMSQPSAYQVLWTLELPGRRGNL